MLLIAVAAATHRPTRVNAAAECGQDGPERPRSADTYVDDSFEAREQIARLEKHEQSHDWRAASRLVESIHARFGHRLIEVGPDRYESISRHLCRRVSAWPVEALAAYRALCDGAARTAYEEALHRRDTDALLRHLDRYLCTSWGASIAAAAAELALESGDVGTAANVATRVLNEHPDRDAVAADWVGRMAVLSAVAGREDEAERWLLRYTEIDRAGTIRWAGDDVPLATLVRSLTSDVRAIAAGDGNDEWPTFGGNGGRDRQARFFFDRLALLWRFDGFAPGSLDRSAEDPESNAGRRALDEGQSLVMHPVVGEGMIYVQDADDVWALAATSGKLVWHYGGADGDALRLGASDGSNAEWHCPTYHDGRVYACLGGDSQPTYGYDASSRFDGLVCLDARTGREVWHLDASRLEVGSVRAGFGSSPLVSPDSVYVVARRRRTFGFEDCYVLRVRASDGTVVHEVHVGSASVGGFGYRRSTRSVPAMSNGTIIVATNLGAIAAVSARTGQVEWLRTYPREPEAQWRRHARSTTEVMPWHYNPVIEAEGQLVCRPTDAPIVLVLRRADGAIVRSVDADRLGGAQTLLGAAGHRFWTTGEDETGAYVYCYDVDADEVAWQSPLPDESRFHGRGVLTAEQVLIPTDAGLCGFALSDGALVAQSWQSRRSGGNVLALADRVIVAGHDHVSMYGRRADIWARLRGRMAARPDDAAPALELAEIAFRAGNREEAVTLLLEGVERGGGFAGIADDAVRRRVYDDCLWFARDWPDDGEANVQQVTRLFEYAGQSAPDRAAHVEYRFRFAEYLAAHGLTERAVTLYQQILNDRSLREAAYGASSDQATAGARARGRIEELIALHGRSVYATFDAEAATWLEAARATGDEALLDRLLLTRPSAAVRSDALECKASLLRRRGEPLRAARVLETAVAQNREQERGAELMRAVADCYDDAGHPDHAWKWVTRSMHAYPRGRVRIARGDGVGSERETVSLERYRQRFAAAREEAEVRRPRVGAVRDKPHGSDAAAREENAFVEKTAGGTDESVAVSARFERSFDGPVELLEPALAATPQSRWDRAYVYVAGKVQALDPKTGRWVWPTPVACSLRPTLLLTTEDRAVFATGYQLLAVDARDGSVAWSAGSTPDAHDAARADPESVASIFGHVYDRGRLMSIRDDGRAGCIEVASGRVIWERALGHRPTSAPVLSGRWAAYRGRPVRPASGAARDEPRDSEKCCLFDAETGDLIRTIELDVGGALLRTHVTLDGRVVLLFTRRAEAYDIAGGQLLWRRSFEDNVVDSTILFDLDGICLSIGGANLCKISLDDGSTLWTGPVEADHDDAGVADPSAGPLSAMNTQGVELVLVDERVVVLSDGGVAALDSVDGRVLWERRPDAAVHLRHRFVGDGGVVVVEGPADDEGGVYTAHVLPLGDSGAPPGADADAFSAGVVLGTFDDVRQVALRDGALLIQVGSTVYGWTLQTNAMDPPLRSTHE